MKIPILSSYNHQKKRRILINVIASITIKEGRVPESIEIFKANIPLVLKEKGCIGYLPTMDVDSGLPFYERDEDVVTIV